VKYLQLQPTPALRQYVQYFWALESYEPGAGPRNFVTIADGFPGIIFHHSADGHTSQGDKILPSLYLYGQTTKYTTIASPGKFRSIGVYFYPHALRSVFGIDAHELTDTCTDLDIFAARYRLREQLFNEQDTHTCVGLISSFIEQCICRNKRKLEPVLHYSLNEIIHSGGNIPLAELHRKTHNTERTFERKFRQAVGMQPRLFARITRFQAALNQLRSHSFSKLSDIAFEQEYADQSHFIRAFKEFAGDTPKRFYKSTLEMVENFPERLV